MRINFLPSISNNNTISKKQNENIVSFNAAKEIKFPEDAFELKEVLKKHIGESQIGNVAAGITKDNESKTVVALFANSEEQATALKRLLNAIGAPLKKIQISITRNNIAQ